VANYRANPLSGDYQNGVAETIPAHRGKTVGDNFASIVGGIRTGQDRVPAFMGLAEATGGVYVENPTGGITSALQQVGLDFEVRKEPGLNVPIQLPTVVDGEPTIETRTLTMPRWYATVAYPHDGGDPFPIAPVGEIYKPVQNTEALAFGDNIVDQGGSLVALGAYGAPIGAKTYAAFQLAEGMTVGGEDVHDLYLTVTNAHDRTGGLTCLVAPIRLDCTNQTYAVFGKRGGNPRFTIRHTTNARGRVIEARTALSLAFAYTDIYTAEAEKLLAVPMPKDQFLIYSREVFRTKAEEDQTKMAQTLLARRDEQLLAILAAETCEFGRGTAYAGYQALIEYSDFYGPARGNATFSRMVRIMEGQTERFKTRAWDVAAAMAS
jgi:phage/plasmid-like protein (TIGR03299 family)